MPIDPGTKLNVPRTQLESLFAIAWEAGRMFQSQYGDLSFQDTAGWYSEGAVWLWEHIHTEHYPDTIEDVDKWYSYVDDGASTMVGWAHRTPINRPVGWEAPDVE